MQWREAWEERVDERLCSPSASERLARRLLDRWGVGCLNSLLFILFPWTLQGCLKRAADKRWTSVTTVQTNLEKIQAWVAGTPALRALNQAEKKLKTRMQALKTGSPPDRVVSDLVNLTIAIQAAADALQEVLEGESDLDADLSTLVIPIHGVVIPIREAVELWLHRHKAFSEEIEKASSQGNSSWRAFWWKQASDSSPSGFISRVAAGVTDSGSPKLAAGAWSSAQGSGEELQTHPWLGRGASSGREWKLISPFADGSAWLWLLLVFCDAHHHRFDENLTSGDRPWWTADRGEGRTLWHTLRHKLAPSLALHRDAQATPTAVLSMHRHRRHGPHCHCHLASQAPRGTERASMVTQLLPSASATDTRDHRRSRRLYGQGSSSTARCGRRRLDLPATRRGKAAPRPRRWRHSAAQQQRTVQPCLDSWT